MSVCLNDDLIQEYLKDSLNDEEKAHADAHLAECDSCRGVLSAHQGKTVVATDVVDRDDQTLVGGTQPTAEELTLTEFDSSSSQGLHGKPPGLHTEVPNAPISAAELAENLSASGLMSLDEIKAFQDSHPPESGLHDAQTLVDALLDDNKLTNYQAQVLRIGQTRGLVLGNYVVQEKIGEGGMGLVFSARHKRMKRTVALKILPPALTQSVEGIARFHREVEAAAKLTHTNIAAAYDADEADGIHFMVIEYVDGPNLSAYVKQYGTIPVAVAIRLALQATRGLAHAHAEGVVHRDIKPGNLLVNSKGTLKILDMGLAQLSAESDEENRELAELTQSGRVMGTVDYMAPEQAVDAKRVDHRADIYSLGCTLYYMVAGRPMSPDGTLTQKLLWHQNEAVPSLKDACSGVTDDLEAVFRKMVAKKPEDRQGSMMELMEDLEDCLAELTTDGLPDMPHIGAGEGHSQPSTSHSMPLGGATIVDRPTKTDIGPAAKKAERPFDLPVDKRGLMIGGAVAAGLLVFIFAAFAMFGDPAPPPVQVGKLRLDIDEVGAEVLIDGRPLASFDGATEQSVTLEVGEHKVNVIKDGFQPVERAVEIEANSTLPLALVLERVPVTIEPVVEPTPPKPDQVRPAAKKAHQNLFTWIFKSGGTAWIAANRGRPSHRITRLEEVPYTPFILSGVDLSETKVQDDDLVRLAEAKGIHTLSLAKTGITDKGLAQVSRFTGLSTLDLSETQITNEGLKYIARLSQLRDLRLGKTSVSGQGLSKIRGLVRLEVLYLADTNVGDADIIPLRSFDRLKHLALNGTHVTDNGHDALLRTLPDLEIAWDGRDLERAIAVWLLKKRGGLSLVTRAGSVITDAKQESDLPFDRFYLTSVDLSSNPSVYNEDLKWVAGLTRLETLRLGGTGVTSVGLAHLRGVQTLKTLDLGSLQLSKSSVDAIRRALPDCEIKSKPSMDGSVAAWVISKGGSVSLRTARGETSPDLNTADQLPKELFRIVSIRLSGIAGIKDADIARLKDLPALETLSLDNTAVSDAGLPHLASCGALRELNLSDTVISNAGLQQLSRFESLQQLQLAGVAIDRVGLRNLARLPNLTHLTLSRTRLADADVGQLKEFSNLTSLDLSNTLVTDGSVAFLKSMTNLEELHFEGTKISDAGFEDLESAMPECKLFGNARSFDRLAALWVLEQGGKVVLDSGPVPNIGQIPRGECKLLKIDLSERKGISREEMAKLLPKCMHVTDLNLRNMRLGDADLAAIARLPELRRLYLGQNRVSDRGVAQLSPIHTLEFLDLQETSVSDTGLADVGKLTSLAYLYLGATRVTDSGMEKLRSLKRLKTLELSGTSIGDAATTSLSGLSNLKTLDISRTRVSETGYQRLRGSLAGCTIKWTAPPRAPERLPQGQGLPPNQGIPPAPFPRRGPPFGGQPGGGPTNFPLPFRN